MKLYCDLQNWACELYGINTDSERETQSKEKENHKLYMIIF